MREKRRGTRSQDHNRLSREDRNRIDEAVKARAYTSQNAFIWAAIQNELNGAA
jgi:hypothetical protein